MIYQLAQGEDRAWFTFYEDYRRMVHTKLTRYHDNAADVEEMVNDVFLRLFTQLQRCPSRFPGMGALVCYMESVIRSVAIDRRRKQRPTCFLSENQPAPLETHAIEQQELREELREILGDVYDPLLSRIGYNMPVKEVCHYYHFSSPRQFYDLRRHAMERSRKFRPQLEIYRSFS